MTDRKIWSVKYRPSEQVPTSTSAYSPTTKSKALDEAKFLAKRNPDWFIWVERTGGKPVKDYVSWQNLGWRAKKLYEQNCVVKDDT